MGVAHGNIEIAVRVAAVAERPAVSRGMRRVWPARTGCLKPVRRRVGQAVHAVGPEVVVLALLAVGDHRRARRFEPLDRVADRFFVERIERRVGAVRLAIASIKPSGRGMLPIGSVGMITGWAGDRASSIRRPRFGASPYHAPRLPGDQAAPLPKPRWGVIFASLARRSSSAGRAADS